MFRLKTVSRALVLGSVLAVGVATAAMADTLLGGYWAYIGRADLFNSGGERLATAAQVLQQDRANLHRFGISQAGDEWDPFFGSYETRSAIARLVRQGGIGPRARDVLRGGGGRVYVKVFGTNAGRLTRLQVTLSP